MNKRGSRAPCNPRGIEDEYPSSPRPDFRPFAPISQESICGYDEHDVDRKDSDFVHLTGVATNKAWFARNFAPMISFYFLADLLERIVDPAIPQIINSEGEDMEFMRLAPAQVRAAPKRAGH